VAICRRLDGHGLDARYDDHHRLRLGPSCGRRPRALRALLTAATAEMMVKASSTWTTSRRARMFLPSSFAHDGGVEHCRIPIAASKQCRCKCILPGQRLRGLMRCKLARNDQGESEEHKRCCWKQTVLAARSVSPGQRLGALMRAKIVACHPLPRRGHLGGRGRIGSSLVLMIGRPAAI
jgi:hypothetical protein